MAEPAYTAVSTNSEQQDGDFPSSFMKDGKSKQNALTRRLRDYNFRRRLICLGVLSVFALAAALMSYELGKIHGHIKPTPKAEVSKATGT